MVKSNRAGHQPCTPRKDATLAKTNYKYEKRQKEIAKKKKKEQKLQEKIARKIEQAKADENAGQPASEEKQEQ